MPPVNIGYIVFPAFEVLDVFGPLSPLNLLSVTVPLNLSIIGPSLEPVSSRLTMATPSFFDESIVPTHTFADPPQDLDVLIVPGGPGTRTPLEQQLPQIALIKAQYPRLKYLISVCTGASLLARAGVLDGRRATSNKAAWAFITSTGPNVSWVPEVRARPRTRRAVLTRAGALGRRRQYLDDERCRGRARRHLRVDRARVGRGPGARHRQQNRVRAAHGPVLGSVRHDLEHDGHCADSWRELLLLISPRRASPWSERALPDLYKRT